MPMLKSVVSIVCVSAVVALPLGGRCAIAAPPAAVQAEPTNAEEAAAKKKAASGIKNIDAWLTDHPGGEKWDVIHFNFGIHDRGTSVADYTARLQQLVQRMKQTGAKLVWASTTPIPDNPDQKQTAASIVERNAAAAEVMQKHGVAIDDLFGFITPRLAEAQLPKDVHFNAQGYDMLGQKVAESVTDALK